MIESSSATAANVPRIHAFRRGCGELRVDQLRGRSDRRHRHRRIELAHDRAQRRFRGGGRAGRPQRDVLRRPGALQVRVIDVELLGREAAVTHVADDADDREPRLLRIELAALHALADHVDGSEMPHRERAADDHHLLRLVVIAARRTDARAEAGCPSPRDSPA